MGKKRTSRKNSKQVKTQRISKNVRLRKRRSGRRSKDRVKEKRAQRSRRSSKTKRKMISGGEMVAPKSSRTMKKGVRAPKSSRTTKKGVRVPKNSRTTKKMVERKSREQSSESQTRNSKITRLTTAAMVPKRTYKVI